MGSIWGVTSEDDKERGLGGLIVVPCSSFLRYRVVQILYQSPIFFPKNKRL